MAGRGDENWARIFARAAGVGSGESCRIRGDGERQQRVSGLADAGPCGGRLDPPAYLLLDRQEIKPGI